jgi:hypothetical protein
MADDCARRSHALLDEMEMAAAHDVSDDQQHGASERLQDIDVTKDLRLVLEDAIDEFLDGHPSTILTRAALVRSSAGQPTGVTLRSAKGGDSCSRSV